MRLLVLLMCFIFVSFSKAQTRDTWEQLYDEISDIVADDTSLPDELLESLWRLHENPICINSATRAELEQLPFLTDQMIEALVAYVYSYGPMRNMGELRLIKELDDRALRLLPLFLSTYVDNSVKRPWTEGLMKVKKSETMLRADASLNQKAGYKYVSPDVLERYPNRVYNGNRLGMTWRASVETHGGISGWLTAQKDPGEPFFAHGVGVDYVVGGVMAEKLGFVRCIVIGDYRLSVGSGLVLGSSFVSLKSSGIQQGVRLRGNIVRRHSSTSEAGFMRGIAATISIARNTELTTFFSRRRIDANLKGDSLLITSLKTDGLHRTKLELSKRGNSRNTLIGANLTMKDKNWRLGITGVVDNYRNMFITRDDNFQKYYSEGNNFFNLGADYAVRRGCFMFDGETAVDKDGALATINQISLNLGRKWNIAGVWRHYSFRYNALHSTAMSEGGMVKNESGLTFRTQGRLGYKFDIEAMADVFRFPWMKRGVSNSSKGAELMVGGTWNSGSRLRVSFRWRGKWKQKDGDDGMLINYSTQRVRLRSDYEPFRWLSLRSEIGACAVAYESTATRWGVMAMQNAELLLGCWQIAIQASFFSTDDYECRLTTYEPGLLYTFSFPSLYYEGGRCALRVRWNPVKHVSLMAKITSTHYFNRSVIGSGTELIDGSTKSDASVQLIWRI